MDIQQILQTLPHRYPFVMVDRVLEITPGERIEAHGIERTEYKIKRILGKP